MNGLSISFQAVRYPYDTVAQPERVD
jgi:hypothetical protein